MKTAAVGPYRRYLAEAKQDAERFDFERGK